jgi:hypothetical protein
MSFINLDKTKNISKSLDETYLNISLIILYMGTNAIDEWKIWLKDGLIMINERCIND